MTPRNGHRQQSVAPEPALFSAVVTPNRSLSHAGFLIVMAIVGGISFVAGMAFLLLGAWPVFGFFGLDVGLVYIAFRHNYRTARGGETLRLAGDAFTVERVGRGGERRLWRFQPFWLRVVLEEQSDRSNRLMVASHGKSLVIADFLAPAARRELASTISDALAAWRQALKPVLAAETSC